MNGSRESLNSVCALMSKCDVSWAVCGGWAIDLFLGHQTRAHGDVDVAVLREDQAHLYAFLAQLRWRIEIAHQGELNPWRGERLELPRHGLWCTHQVHKPSFFEVLLNEHDGTHFVFRRAPTIRLELERALLCDASGVRILAPEIVLLFKSKQWEQDRHAHDFKVALPALSSRQRQWLREALSFLYEQHAWLDAIDRHQHDMGR